LERALFVVPLLCIPRFPDDVPSNTLYLLFSSQPTTVPILSRGEAPEEDGTKKGRITSGEPCVPSKGRRCLPFPPQRSPLRFFAGFDSLIFRRHPGLPSDLSLSLCRELPASFPPLLPGCQLRLSCQAVFSFPFKRVPLFGLGPFFW